VERLARVIGVGVVVGFLADSHIVAGQLLGEGLQLGESARDLDRLFLEAHPKKVGESPRRPRERSHACNDGWMTLGQIVVDPETGAETEEYALCLCCKCAERS
jgi:hypothetical protein